MDPAIVALVLFAALLHVAWNILLKTAGDPMAAATVGIAAAAIVIVPAATIGWLAAGRPAIPPSALALAALSGAIETAYFVSLSAAYRHGDLSLVYPTARGTAPLLAVVIGVVVFGERLEVPGTIGVTALLAGILLLTRPWRLFVGHTLGSDRLGTAYALATGVFIATYSAVDRVGARLTEPWLYAALIWPAMAVGLIGWRTLGAGRRPSALIELATPPPTSRPPGSGALRGGPASPAAADPPLDAPRAVIGGLLTLAAYTLILFAYTQAPLTAVAPLRESAVIVASGWGAVRLAEAEGRRDLARRLVAAGLVVIGIVLLVFEG